MTSLSSTTSSLQKYINVVSKNQLTWYMEQNSTFKEEQEYYASEDYELHLNYLIETWVSIIKNEFEFDHDDDTNFYKVSKLFDDGYYWPEFNSEWLDDIFEHHILDKVCLK
jgi:hypothetical protein